MHTGARTVAAADASSTARARVVGRSEGTAHGNGYATATLTSRGRGEPIEEGGRDHRLDVQPLHDRDLGAADEGPVVTTGLGLAVRRKAGSRGDAADNRGCRRDALVLDRTALGHDRPESALAEQILVDRDIGELRLEGGAERRVQVDSSEVTVGIGGQLVVRRRAERLGAEPQEDRERHERDRKLRIQPLDLERALRVRVQIEGGLCADTNRAAGDSADGSGREAGFTVADASGVAESCLAPVGIDLEPEHSLGRTDFTDDVEPASGSPIPLLVAIPSKVGVERAHVAREGHIVVDEARDAYRWCWSGRLRQSLGGRQETGKTQCTEEKS